MSDQFLSPAPKSLEERILELFGGPSNAAEWMQNKDLEAMERRNEMRAELEAAGGGPLLDRPIPGANPEVPTVSDALLGSLMAAAPMAGLVGRTAGGGNAPARAPGSRTHGDYVELFSGGGTGANWTTDPKRAASFARNPDDVLRVKVPRSVFEAGNKEAAKFGQPSRFDAVLPGEWANKATRTRIEPDVYVIKE